MRKSLLIGFCLCILSIAFSLAGCNSINLKNRLPSSMPADFNFIFNFGGGAKNQLDTVKGQFTKDMIVDPPITVELKLSDEEMNVIYSDMRRIGIMNYPENYDPKSNMIQFPSDTYSIKIIANGREKSIYWEDKSVSNTKKAAQLRELFNKIAEMIISKDEYKKLPASKGGYM